MKKLISVLAIGAAFSLNALAQTAAPAMAEKAPTTQQNKMSMCNKDAAGKKGDERKAFMKGCLSNQPSYSAPVVKQTQQEKMKTCNAEAKTSALKGDERKVFMKTCLSAK